VGTYLGVGMHLRGVLMLDLLKDWALIRGRHLFEKGTLSRHYSIQII